MGRAPPSAEPGAELTVAQEQAIAANVELARNAGSRYLVQRWGDGTYCEKTGKKREIEIQVSIYPACGVFFCSHASDCGVGGVVVAR